MSKRENYDLGRDPKGVDIFKQKRISLLKEIIEGSLMLPFEISDREANMILMNLEQRLFVKNEE